MKVYKTKITKIDNVNTGFYDKDDMLVKIPHKISEEEISKLNILKWEYTSDGNNYSIVLEEKPTEYVVCENRPTQDRAIWEYFWYKLNFPERKLNTFVLSK